MALPPQIPKIKTDDPPLVDYLRRTLLWADTELKGKVPQLTAVDGVLFQAPNGSVWKLSVSNTGTVVTTSIRVGSTR